MSFSEIAATNLYDPGRCYPEAINTRGDERLGVDIESFARLEARQDNDLSYYYK
ncbi:MAG: hypothetical protein K9L79_06300 [Methylobacter tundripaludum]|nr:hypothetical protein [Methylobacter tundripaludum]